MADIPTLQNFATQNGFGMTEPLDGPSARTLAEYWCPEIRFYPEEKFHPIPLDNMISMVEDLYSQLAPAVQDNWKVSKLVRAADGVSGEIRQFDPPVITAPDGMVQFAPNVKLPAVKVLNEAAATRDAMADSEVDKKATITHGASFTRADQFFGGSQTASGGNVASDGDPFLPRAIDGNGDPEITVLASYKNLIDLLKYEILVANDENYPPDALRTGFDIVDSLFKTTGQFGSMPDDIKRGVLLDVILAFESGDSISDALQGIPPGWVFDEKAWDVVTRYAFLEYYFFYAYNDFDRYQTTPFENEHEGDDEGCCLVFDRNVIAAAASGQAPDVRQAVPTAIITSVHEEFQKADKFEMLAPPAPNSPNSLPREDMELIVYPAAGSHATYLSPGNHDLVDFQDTIDFIGEDFPWLWLVPVPGLPIAIAVLVSIIDHFVDTEDLTSDDGLYGGPDGVVSTSNNPVKTNVMMLPMSQDEQIYDNNHTDLLRLASFPGKWGGHDSFRDESPPFKPKSGRYFRQLLKGL